MSRRTLPILALLAGLATLASARAPQAPQPQPAAVLPAAAGKADPGPQPPEAIPFGHFGEVPIYRPTAHPRHVVIFLSGDGGWNGEAVTMAKLLAAQDALVIGVNVPRYLHRLGQSKRACTFPAGDFEMLSKYVQRTLGLPDYVPPVLVGYSSGATLAYAVLAEAPPNTFRGAISMGFCPDLPLEKPFCSENGLAWGPGPGGKGISFKPAKTLEAPWIAFQGKDDKLCKAAAVVAYAKQVKGAEVVLVSTVGHGFAHQPDWAPQFRAALAKLLAPAPAAAPISAPAGQPPQDSRAAEARAPVSDLPLVEVPAKGGAAGDTFAVILSGDGGWAGLDREVAGALSERGIPTVGFNSLQYFWKARTPDASARDLERILRHYAAAWNRPKVLLIGYSFGADVLPFLAARLPADLAQRVELIALLGPSKKADFEFHVTDWLGGGDSGLPVLPEVQKLHGKPLLCLYGTDEDDSLCHDVRPPLGKSVAFAGGHHFGGGYAAVADQILREVHPEAGR
jgi:type IV secretory pathway VirJ component